MKTITTLILTLALTANSAFAGKVVSKDSVADPYIVIIKTYDQNKNPTAALSNDSLVQFKLCDTTESKCWDLGVKGRYYTLAELKRAGFSKATTLLSKTGRTLKYGAAILLGGTLGFLVGAKALVAWFAIEGLEALGIGIAGGVIGAGAGSVVAAIVNYKNDLYLIAKSGKMGKGYQVLKFQDKEQRVNVSVHALAASINDRLMGIDWY